MRKTLCAALLFAALPVSAQEAMNNDAVIKMIKGGLSDDLVITAVSSKPGNYDTTTDGILALKSAGVSDKVIGTLIVKASGASGPEAAPPAAANIAPPLPPGIDEIGVYYKDKEGNWVSLTSEVVNFKTGGFMKSLATDGIVKGDINGHIQGEHGKVTMTFPVKIAVYMPQGTEITEYQLLRLRPSGGHSREFRSVTGGVFHASGGARRDLIAFDSTKIAPHIYEITLKQESGKGEYGLLPPGSLSSSNLASAGKIYTLSVPE